MIKPNPLKFIIKRSLHHIAAKFGNHVRSSSDEQLLVLMYHRVIPDHDERIRFEEPGMLVSPATFKKNLEVLAKHFQFIQLSEWIERQSKGFPLPKKSCVITFDDGWRDNYEYAFPILQEMAIPATIFLVSDMIGTNKMFWPERLARTVTEIAEKSPGYWLNPSIGWLKAARTDYRFNDIAPTQEELTQLIAHTKGFSDQKAHALLDIITKDLGLDESQYQPALMNWEQVSEMTDTGLIDVGSHTCHHIRLNHQTPTKTLEKEIISSKNKIEAFTGLPVKTFCFPNGDYSQEALTIVRQQYLGAVTTNSGWNSSKTDHHLLQRIGIHEDIAKDEIAFLARISGWF